MQNKEIQAIQTICEPLRSMAIRLEKAQAKIQSSHPSEAKNLAEVREQLARITKIAYDTIGLQMPVWPAS